MAPDSEPLSSETLMPNGLQIAAGGAFEHLH